jgi:hypothetical protein
MWPKAPSDYLDFTFVFLAASSSNQFAVFELNIEATSAGSTLRWQVIRFDFKISSNLLSFAHLVFLL